MARRKDYHSALELRLAGQTYGEIKKTLGIPKSTLSTWFKCITLSKSTKKILENKTRQGILSLIEFNKIKTREIIRDNQNTRVSFQKKVGKLKSRELMLVGAALYWAEGYKNHNPKQRSYPYLNFSNSDPYMVKVFIMFLENILEIPRSKLSASAMIYPGLNPTSAVDYWHNVSGIPKERMRYYIALSRASSGKRPKNLLPHGTLQIRVNDRLNFFKTMGLVDGIIKNV